MPRNKKETEKTNKRKQQIKTQQSKKTQINHENDITHAQGTVILIGKLIENNGNKLYDNILSNNCLENRNK